MIVWQVDWNHSDSNHKLFILAKNRHTHGMSKRSSSITPFSRASLRGGAYYFYMEFIK